MSENRQTAPKILTATPRGTRRLNALPTYGLLALGGVLAASAVLILHGARDGAAPSSGGDAKPVAASSSGALAGFPSHGEIPVKQLAAVRTPAPATTSQRTQAAEPAASPVPAPAAPDDDIHAQALRQQWQQYYQQVAQLREQRRQAAVDAVRGDTSVAMDEQPGARASQVAGGDPEVAAARMEARQAQAAAAVGGRGGGGAGGQQGQSTPRPGALYEGPSHPSRDYLNAGVTAPISRFEVKAGERVLIRFTSGVSSEAPGQWVGMVIKPVFDHATGLHTLVPAGTRVVGAYDQLMTVGSERLPGGATRFIYPGEDGGSLDVGSMPIGDQAGYAGMRDRVDRHIGRLVFNSVLLGLAGGAAQLTQPRSNSNNGFNASQLLAAQLGLQFGAVGSEYARRELQTRPTHTVRPGWTGTVQITQDIAFPGEWIDGVGFVP